MRGTGISSSGPGTWGEILRGVTLRVETGQVGSIIGPNGAGKSTVFKALFGLLPAWQGQIRFDEADVTNRPPAELLRRGMAYVPQGRNVFPLMTVEENLLLGAYIRPRSAELDREVERVYETFPMLREARTLSVNRRRDGALRQHTEAGDRARKPLRVSSTTGLHSTRSSMVPSRRGEMRTWPAVRACFPCYAIARRSRAGELESAVLSGGGR
jgi:ABC-type branched-subunit amino acid transport system ATPase component